MTFDPTQRFLSFVPGGNGIIYGIQADGTLLWYRHAGWQTGAVSWANGGNGRTIGSAWHQFDTVLGSADGTFFAFRPDGTLLWYQYLVSNLNTGAGSWHPASGSQIGSGWNIYTRVFGGWDGVIYGLDLAGNLRWYRYAGANGSSAWGANSGVQIGAGWKPFSWISADPNGVIYAWELVDALNWWRYVVPNPATGVGSWANGGNAVQIGGGWGETFQKTFFSNGSGTLYAIDLDNSVNPGDDTTLNWYRLLTSQNVDTQGATWANSGSGNQIGSGFTMQNSAALQGYPSSLSTPLGGSVGIQVSTTWSTYTSTVVRLAPAAGAPVSMVGATARSGRLQPVQSSYRSLGCGWSTDFTVSVPGAWASGVYAAQLRSPYSNEHDVTFVVRPSTPTQKIAVLIPTNTYNAYNTWGGHDQYTVGQDNVQRTVTLLRPSVPAQSKPTGFLSMSLYSDLLLLQWMTANGIQFECYTDGDLDLSGSWLSSYKAVVLCSHPEYWTEAARTNIKNYQQLGGRVVYTGGNGIYEKVTYTPDRSAIVFRLPNGDRNTFEALREPADQILGVDYNPATYIEFAPYRVVTNHAFLAGTGLAVGDTFGSVAYNVAASGWEVDASPGGIAGQVIIARGTNPFGGADMSYLPKPAGGWVFAAGSINFNGAVPYDSAIQKILTNVFAAAVA